MGCEHPDQTHAAGAANKHLVQAQVEAHQFVPVILRRGGVSLRKALVDHGATAALEACGDAIVTGMTQTNANDLVLIVIR